jgi:anti-sigma regulatory factor (Ser/Thr protein kinase)
VSNTRHLSVPARFDQLIRLTAFAVESARTVGFEKLQLDRIELAMDEACSNIIEHAYAGSAGRIDIEIEAEPDSYIRIVLTDTGKAFEPDKVPAYVPCTSETDVNGLKVGGLGIHLMRQAMDEVCFEFNVRDEARNNGKTGVFNRLTMVKRR